MGVPVFGINAWKRSTSALERKNAEVDKHWDGLRFWTLGWFVNLNTGMNCVSEHWDGLWIWTLGWIVFLNIEMDCESQLGMGCVSNLERTCKEIMLLIVRMRRTRCWSATGKWSENDKREWSEMLQRSRFSRLVTNSKQGWASPAARPGSRWSLSLSWWQRCCWSKK